MLPSWIPFAKICALRDSTLSSLIPFAVYSVVFGLVSVVHFGTT